MVTDLLDLLFSSSLSFLPSCGSKRSLYIVNNVTQTLYHTLIISWVMITYLVFGTMKRTQCLILIWTDTLDKNIQIWLRKTRLVLLLTYITMTMAIHIICIKPISNFPLSVSNKQRSVMLLLINMLFCQFLGLLCILSTN